MNFFLTKILGLGSLIVGILIIKYIYNKPSKNTGLDTDNKVYMIGFALIIFGLIVLFGKSHLK